MTNKVVVADAGPLIAFGRINQLKLLQKTVGEIIAPFSVIQECIQDANKPGAKEILTAMDDKIKIIITHPNPPLEKHQNITSILGPGEASAIILAAQLGAKLLIDEKLGRQAAQKLDIPIIGTAGVLLSAKKKKIIKKIEPLIRELKKSGYFLSESLIEEILSKAKELPRS